MLDHQPNPYEPPGNVIEEARPASNRWILRLLAFPAAALAFFVISLLVSHNEFAKLQEGLAGGFVAAIIVFFTIIALTDRRGAVG